MDGLLRQVSRWLALSSLVLSAGYRRGRLDLASSVRIRGSDSRRVGGGWVQLGVSSLGGWGFYLPFPGSLCHPVIFLLPCSGLVLPTAGWLRLVLAVGILLGVLRAAVLPRGSSLASTVGRGAGV